MQRLSTPLLLLGLLAFAALSMVFTACLPDGKGIDWPAISKCAPPLPEVVALVTGILTNGNGPAIDDSEIALLEDAAVKYGAAAIECAVNDFVARETGPNGRARTSAVIGDAASRGYDFLSRFAHQKPAAE